jgi:hypothetical protein
MTYLCAVGALVLLWLVYPQDYSYTAAARTGLQFYPGQARAPCSPPDPLPLPAQLCKDALMLMTGQQSRCKLLRQAQCCRHRSNELSHLEPA